MHQLPSRLTISDIGTATKAIHSYLHKLGLHGQIDHPEYSWQVIEEAVMCGLDAIGMPVEQVRENERFLLEHVVHDYVSPF